MAADERSYTHLEHGFDPVFDGRSRVLVLGSFPSVLSRQNAFYYGNPRNRFWNVIADCLGVAVPPNECPGVSLEMSISAKRRMLLEGRVALWDVIQSCDIKGSSDASIRNAIPVDAARVLQAAPIEAVLCNGATAGRLYRRYLEEVTGMPATVLPSTSPANAAWSQPRLKEVWSTAFDWRGFRDC